MKKFISIALTIALLLTTCLIAGIIPANASTQTWLEFEAKNMEYHMMNGTNNMWYAYTSNPYRCLIQPALAVSAKDGKSVVRKYTALRSGTFRIETGTWGVTGLKVTNGASTDYVKFAITDKEGKILWPENGQPLTIYSGTIHELNTTIPLEANDELYFIFYDATAETLYSYLNTVMYVGETAGNYANQVHDGGSPANSDHGATNDGSVVYEGVGYWNYMYADSVTESNFDPNASTDNGGDIYAADYTTIPMNKISTANGDSNNGYIGGGTYGKTTFAQSQNVYLKTGETAIVRYTATADGTFDIGYCGVKLMESTNAVGAWKDNQGCDFMILDNDGNVIYPEYGGPAQLRGTDTPTDNATVPSRLYHYNMKQGEHLDFVFKPTATVPTFGTAYVNMSGSFSFNGSRIDASGRLNLSPSEAQGKRGVTMLYSTDFVVDKLIRDEWTDYVQLSKTFAAAPATVEAYVNIPANVPDWKRSVILSDMGGADEANGFEVAVDVLGHPRLILAGGEIDVTFDAVDLRTGKWEHIVYTYDAATGEAKFYLNGALADTKTAAAVALAASDRKAVIGNDMTYTKSSAFQGAMKKLAVYSDARTVDEVAADMASVSASADGLIGYWVLNGSYSDKSSNANTGVLTTVGTAWYKADAPADAEEGEFTIVHTGDQQIVSDFIYGLYPKMTEWLAANKERLNIKAVINTGDLVNNEEVASQWDDAINGTNILLEAKIPYIFAIGNHEYPSSGTKNRNPATLNARFPISTYFTQGEGEDTTQIIYSYPNTEKLTSVDEITSETIENAVYVQTINGKTFIYFAIEVQPRDIVVDWANTVMPKIEEEYPDATTIIGTHHYLTAQGKIDTSLGCFTEAHRLECNSPAEFYDNFVKKYKSISLVLNGHVASDIATRTDIGVNGNKIVSIMNDASYEGDGGQGVLLLLRYKADGTVKAEYYSPLLDAYYKANSQFEYSADKDSAMIDISAIKPMGYCRTSDNYWFPSNGNSAYVWGRTINAYGNMAVARSYTAPSDGTLVFKNQILYQKASSLNVDYAVCKEDGTVLYPTDGSAWKTITGTDYNKTHTTTVSLKTGESVYIVFRNNSGSDAAYCYAISYGTFNGAAINSYDQMSSTQGGNGWSSYYVEKGTDNVVEVSPTYDISYSATEGGTITAQTGGTWAADKLTIANGGTAYFTTKPAPGYKFAGYYIDGRLCSTNRRLVYANVTSDMVVEARFEKIKQAGDANFDGTVDILDLVTMKKNPTAVNALMADLYDPDNENIIDDNDSAALRTKLLK